MFGIYFMIKTLQVLLDLRRIFMAVKRTGSFRVLILRIRPKNVQQQINKIDLKKNLFRPFLLDLHVESGRSWGR